MNNNHTKLGGLRKSRSLRRKLQETVAGYVFISPWIVGLLCFTVWPIIASLYYSLTNYSLTSDFNYVGFRNYKNLFFGDALFWVSLRVTVYYIVGTVPLQIVSALLVAVLLNQKIRGVIWYRLVYYIPVVLPPVATYLLWSWIFHSESGILNNLLRVVGIEGPNWLGDPGWVVPALILMSGWLIGGIVIIFLSGLQSVPRHLYEVVDIDGGNAWHKFRYVTIPMLTPVIFFNLVMQVIWSFQVFAQAFIMTQGGPANASLFYAYYLYLNAFRYQKMGYASTMAWVMFVVIMALTLLIFKSSKWWVYYEADIRRRR